MITDQQDRALELFERLTDRERAVLDCVLEHKTTKEIARDLGVSPNTVDQRLRSARQKLGTSDRNATARAYAGLLSLCGKTTCGSPVVFELSSAEQAPSQARREEATFVLHDAGWFDRPAPWDTKVEQTIGLEAFGDSLGVWKRVALVVGLAALVALIVLATFAIAQSLSSLELPGFLTT